MVVKIWMAVKIIYIHDLCVCPKARGMGVARLLLEHLYIFARDNGFLKLCAIAVQGAERFWLRQNFVKVKPYSYNGTSGNGTPGTLMVREI
ncbi:MAG: GNAT family N-acetyltransferase [Alphaproteobacteria bacterium]